MNNESIYSRSSFIPTATNFYPEHSNDSQSGSFEVENRDVFSDIFDSYAYESSNENYSNDEDIRELSKDDFSNEDSVIEDNNDDQDQLDKTDEAQVLNENGQPLSTEKVNKKTQSDKLSGKAKEDSDSQKITSTLALKLRNGKTNEEGLADDQKKSAAKIVVDPKGEASDAANKKLSALKNNLGQKVKDLVTDKQAKNAADSKQLTKLKNSVDIQSDKESDKPGYSIKNLSKKKGSKASAKNSRSVVGVNQAGSFDEFKKSLKTAQLDGLRESGGLEKEIGIKSAKQVSEQIKPMLTKHKDTDDKATDKGFLKDSTESASNHRAQSVSSRSDMGGMMNQSNSGSRDHNSNQREGFRQWLVDNAETKSTAQAAQQSQFIDKQLGSQLSAHVLNKIVTHIEKMRESEKNRVRVSLGSSEKGRISVDIRIEDGNITTSFEGDEDILDELKRDWNDISDRAKKQGVSLSDPEFISSSSSVKSEFSFSDSGKELEEKSQSVIQHKDNQLVRPVIQTAAAESSSPVHSYA